MVLGEQSAHLLRGRYRLLELVGEGANARVYTADDLTLRRRVAVKVLRGDLAGDEAFKQRFEQEMRAASALSLPRVLPVYDWGLEPVPHLVTEHVTGGSLADMLAAGHRLSPSQALAVGLEVARALVRVHGAGIAYCGLTASSIMFDSQARVFVSDLGVVAALATAGPAESGSDDGDPLRTGVERSRGEGGLEGEAGPEDTSAVTLNEQGSRLEAAETRDADAAGASPVEPDPWGIETDTWDTEVWDLETWGLDDAGGREAASRSAEPTGAVTAPEPSHESSDERQDVYDLALILNEAVTGVRSAPREEHGQSVPASILLGPLQMPLERATTADPTVRLDSAGLVEELLRVARLLPRPDPLPIVSAEAAVARDTNLRPLDPVPVPSGGLEGRVYSAVSRLSAIPLDDVLRRRWPGLVLAVALVLGGGTAGVWAWIDSRPETAPMPELTGRSRVAAVRSVTELGWDVQEVLVREPGTRRGEVVRTEPAAGVELGDAATIDLFVSLGEPLVALDFDLYGHTALDATELLDGRGLVAEGERRVTDEAVPPGLVVGLDVADGVYELEVGSPVGLLVSDGPADRIVPEAPGERTPPAAADALLVARLEPREVTEFSEDVPAGEVIGFRPASGRAVEADAVVEIRVSLGPEPRAPEEPAEVEETEASDGAGEGGDASPS